MAVLRAEQACLLVLALLAAAVTAATPPASSSSSNTGSHAGQAKPADVVLPDLHKVVASHRYLWPVNANKMVNITLIGAKDPAGGPVTITIEHVTSTQPPKAYNAPLCPDSQIGPSASWVTLRAERLNSTARLYRIYYRATTQRGTFRKGVVPVCVPAVSPNMENALNSCPTAARLFKKWNSGDCGGPGDWMGHKHLKDTPFVPQPKLGNPIKPHLSSKAAAGSTGHHTVSSHTPHTHPTPAAVPSTSTTTTTTTTTTTSSSSSSSSSAGHHPKADNPMELIPFLRLTFKHAKCYQVDFASPPFLTNVTRLAGELVGFSLGKAGTVAVVKNGEDADCQENHAAGNVAVNFPLVIMAATSADGDVLPLIINQTDQGKLFSAWCGAGAPHAAMCSDWDLSDAAVVLDYGKPVVVATSSIGPIVMSAD